MVVKSSGSEETQGLNNTGTLKAGFSPAGMWAFSIGTSIGWGSFIVTCNTYLQKSGVLGTVFGLLLGMAVILVVTWNLQYMIQEKTGAGGAYTFVKETCSKDLGFVTFWFVLLTYFAILWANITSVPLFARFFLGSAFQFGFRYSVFGYEVWLGEALLSIGAVVVTGFLCTTASRYPNRIMTAAAVVFSAGFTICAVIAMMRHGNSFSYEPLYSEGSSAFGQIIRIAAISPWAFIGFENISHFSEEYDFPIKKVRGILICSVVMTTALYLFVSILSVSAYPPEYQSWQEYLRDMGNLQGIKAVPTFYAADHYLGQKGVAVLMLALFGVILTSLIGNLMALSRIIFAAGREGEALGQMSELSRQGVPEKAIFVIVAVSVFIPFLGRTAIGWIVDVTTLGATMIYGLVSYATFKHAESAKKSVEKVTGVIGMVLMLLFIMLLLIPGLLPFDAMETESYILFIIWAILGLIYFGFLIHKDSNREYEHHFMVWIILLVLILFASMMWVSRETENAANRAAENIYAYHQAHHESDAGSDTGTARIAFLEEQAKHISSMNTMYTMVSLMLFIICAGILLHNYINSKKLGKQLTAAEKEAEDARKIAELKESITALLDNMPAMSFSKDAETGEFLACNQAFAEYSNKEKPEDVVGLKASDIFDKETAELFDREDKITLSMDEPYVVFEDVPDAAGNRKQLQTTKIKFIDASGKPCVLGMSQDVTDMVRIKRENATTKEAYERDRSNSIIVTHIAQTLAHGYEDLFYVNVENGDYIEFGTDEETGALKEIRRGGDFFESCIREADIYVYPEDRAEFKRSLNQGILMNTLKRNKTFIMSYRLLTDNDSVYVNTTVTKMEDDERFIILGVANVNEEVKQRRTTERIMEERIAYSRLNALTGDFLCVYVVDPETGRYREFSATEGTNGLSLPKMGMGFFDISREHISRLIYPEDLERFLSMYTKEGILSETEQGRMFSLSFRLMINENSHYVQLRAAMVEEKEGRRLIVGVNDIEAQVQQEEAYAKRLAQAQIIANVDALTGVKNKHAYQEEEERLNLMIANQQAPEFALVILDVNDLKKVNDTQGHQAGDKYICDACKLICDNFKRSPVFRTGGDEFLVIAEGEDYRSIEELMDNINAHNREAVAAGGIVIACGMSRWENDDKVSAVFERADKLMYENKSRLKKEKAEAL